MMFVFALPSPTQPAKAVSPAPGLPGGDFEQVYDAYFDFVWKNVRRLGVPDAQVDDAVQDVFLAVHRRLPEFRGEASLKTWLFHFVLKVTATYRRSAGARDRKHEAVSHEGSAPVATPDSAVEEKQAVKLLHRLLGELSEERRELFVLVEIEAVSVAEAAQVLGLNVNTAHSRLRDARRDFEAAVSRERAKEDWRSR